MHKNLKEYLEVCNIFLNQNKRKERSMDKLPICCGQGIAPYCPSCGSEEYLHNEDGNENNFCGQCGCPLDWSEMYNEDAERIEE